MIEEDFTVYNGANTTLRRAQLRMLDILIEVNKICQDQGIKYWIDYGTLLGAIRHKGFIPWDDDLDISVLKKDFKKFSSAMKNYLPESLAYQDWRNEKKLTLKVAKIRDRNSYYDDGIYQRGALNYDGIFIDVFPVEYVPSKKFKFFVDFFYGRAFRRLRGTNVNPFEKFIAYCMYPLSLPLVFLSRFSSKLFNSRLLMNTYGGLNFKNAHSENEIFPLQKIYFEGHLFYAPKNTDQHLRNIYGDYMRIPEKENRKTHALKIEFLED